MLRLSPAEQERLKASRRLFTEGDPLPPALLSDAVARSWTRSRLAGIVPWQKPRFDPPERVTTQSAGSEFDRRLRRAVHAEMEPLWNAFGGPHWALFCVNKESIVIDARQSVISEERAIRAITVGRDLSERAIGTTAPSCALSDGVETVVEGNQHFLAEFESLFCLSVPLRGFDGDVVGALDITGRGERDVDMLRQHFRYAALSTELRMIESLGQCHLLRLQADPRWLATPLAGMIAVEGDGNLRAASLLGRRMLGLPSSGSVRGFSLDALFPEATSVQRRRLLTPAITPQRIARSDGSHVWVQYQRAPLRGSESLAGDSQHMPAPAPPVVASTDWREQRLRTIVEVLHDFDGNVAAAARHLKVSRTTLYARIEEIRRTGLL